MQKEGLFDKEYVEEATSTAGAPTKSPLKEFIKEPVEKKEFRRYGGSKPTRLVIRAKLIHDKS
jgi:hypothetical protein